MCQSAVGWLWTVEFFASIQFTSVAGACADWYFTPEDEDGDKDVQYMALFRSISRTVRFHMGTMAVGCAIMNGSTHPFQWKLIRCGG